MYLLDDLVEGKIMIDLSESLNEDISKLSKKIEVEYPNLSKRFSPTYCCLTLKSYADQFGDESPYCFYNAGSVTWDGYKKFEYSDFKIEQLFRADEILNDSYLNVKEDDVMKLLNV